MERVKKNSLDNVVLENERSQGVEKLVNELTTFKFFKYIYAKSMFKMFGLNLLMCLFLIPLLVVYYKYIMSMSAVTSTMSLNASVGLGFSYWVGATEYYQTAVNSLKSTFWLWAIPSIAVTSIAFAGGVAVVRNAFWTGELNVSKNFYKGIYQCGLVAFIGFALVSGAICGLQHLNFVLATLPSFVSIIINVVAWILIAFIGIIFFVLTSVIATYKQTLSVSIKTTFAIIRQYFMSTVLNFIMSLMPIFIVLLFGTSQLFIIVIVLIGMIGMYYVALVWQTHMMKIFSIYHPVEKKVVKHKKQYK